ncbi:hypothetical protein CDAR_245701 [Caerostris darwini]|uniref:Uncharacterized protein n=1 Tax=Caerostris darwini TaxID=1538125 RepID=A0AAV4S0H7_9ARAC|nr:hypothetical protein CDAR_245701 [Caerostris darwini]
MRQQSNNSHSNYFKALKNNSERFQRFVKRTDNCKKIKKATPTIHCSFKEFVLRVKRLVSPKMKLGSLTLKEMGNFIVHMIELLEEDLANLNRMNPKNTLGLE